MFETVEAEHLDASWASQGESGLQTMALWRLLDAVVGKLQLGMSTEAARYVFLRLASPQKDPLVMCLSASAFVMDVSPPKPASS